MSSLEMDQVLGLALTAAFAFLALAAWRTWTRYGSTLHAHLGTASALLGAICVAFRIQDLTGSNAPALAQFAMVALLGSAAALLTVRHTLAPLSRRADILARVSLVGGLLVAIAVPFPLEPEASFTPRQLVAAGFVAAVWSVCVAEPIFRFWVMSRGLSIVQRSRLRALSIGYGGLIALLGVAVAMIGAEEAAGAPEMELVVLTGALALTAVQFIAFVPPRWLRRLWREREERILLHTAPRLLLSDDPGALGHRTLEWAVRLVGADAGFVIDAEGRLAALEGISAAEAEALRHDVTGAAPAILRPDGGRPVAALPLRLEGGTGTLVVIPGPLTPPFGKDELALLSFQADTAAAALDRAKLDDMRRAFLTALSHELRTPLTSVVGIGRTLQIAGNGRLDDDRRALLVDRLVVNAQRLEVMLSDLLDVDRLSRGIIEPRCAPTDVGALIRRVVESSSDTLGGRRTVVDIPALDGFVDPPMVERIVENLVANAAKHTPRDASIWVWARSADDELHLMVADDGPGVPSGVRETIFEPFHRGPGAPEHAPGTGIGLSLVARFAELHGGRAWVEDRPGGGAAFHVVLPQTSDPTCSDTMDVFEHVS